jgi:hypothetical protein
VRGSVADQRRIGLHGERGCVQEEPANGESKLTVTTQTHNFIYTLYLVNIISFIHT